jgi:hypothetical protein
MKMATQMTLKRCTSIVSANDDLDELGKRLQSAHPLLIVRVKNVGHLRFENIPSTREVDPGWDELIDEGYDPSGSPLGPVY